jgi:Protein of unknown function (DUF4019)
MKTTRLTALGSISIIAALTLLAFAAAPTALASADNEVDSALAAAKAWAAQIDAGQYDESYLFGCEAMHDKVPQDRWDLVLKALRAPWGPVVSRKQVSHVYQPNGYQGTEGEFMVITYDTAFQKFGPAMEVIVLKWEDGKWRGAGYNAKAKPSPDDASAPPSTPASSTEIHTQDHVKPLPQSPAQ